MRALILALMLAGCASHNLRDTVALGDMDRDGCIAIRCQAYCRESATDEQRAAFLAGTIDDGEREQLRRLGWWLTGDTATTIVGLSLCESARELNPIIGADPHWGVVVAYNGVAYLTAKHYAAKSPYWCSGSRGIKTAANVRMVASISNAAMVGLCR